MENLIYFCKTSFFHYFWMSLLYHAAHSLSQQWLNTSVVCKKGATALCAELSSLFLNSYASGHRHFQNYHSSVFSLENWTATVSFLHFTHVMSQSAAVTQRYFKKHGTALSQYSVHYVFIRRMTMVGNATKQTMVKTTEDWGRGAQEWVVISRKLLRVCPRAQHEVHATVL